MRLLGLPQTPDWPFSRPVEHAFGVAFSLPAVAGFCTFAQKVQGRICALKSTPEPAQFHNIWLLKIIDIDITAIVGV